MKDSERPSTPESVWKSIGGKEEASMGITFTPDQLYAMARSRERENLWGQRIGLILFTGLAGVCAYNVISVHQIWPRLSEAWLFAWSCLLAWGVGRGPRRMNPAESCASFLRRSYESKRVGFLALRWYLFLLIPPFLASWWTGGARALRLSRLKALGVEPSSRLYEFSSGPWLLIIVLVSLVFIWFAFGLAAKKAERELDELRRRTQG
jgi:hypothetical protein